MALVQPSTNRQVWIDYDAENDDVRKAVITQNVVMLYRNGQETEMVSKAEFEALVAGGEPEPVAEPVPETCEVVIKNLLLADKVCGRDLPCRYHTED